MNRPIRPCFACNQKKDEFYLVTLPHQGEDQEVYPQLCPECIGILVGKAARKYRTGKEAVLTLVVDNAIIDLTGKESA